MTANANAFWEGVTWYCNGKDQAKEQQDNAIRQANEQATHNLGASLTLNASFDTVCEISSNNSVASITEQSYFSSNNTNTTGTPDKSLQLTHSDSPKWSQEKHDDS